MESLNIMNIKKKRRYKPILVVFLIEVDPTFGVSVTVATGEKERNQRYDIGATASHSIHAGAGERAGFVISSSSKSYWTQTAVRV